MKTNRRGFMQTIAGFLVIPFLPKSKAKPDVVFAQRKPKDSLGGWEALQSEAKPRNIRIEYCTFRGYRFMGVGNGISWKEIGPPATLGTWVRAIYTKLPTFDTIRYFHVHEDQLFWIGEHETWEIQYTGEKNHPFQWTPALAEWHNFTVTIHQRARTFKKENNQQEKQ